MADKDVQVIRVQDGDQVMQPCPDCGINFLHQVAGDGRLVPIPQAHICPYHAGLADQDIQEALIALAVHRERAAAFRATVDKLQEEFNTRPEIQALKADQEANRHQVDLWDGFIRRRAVRAFQETGEKTYAGGVKVQERTEIDFDRAQALQWARQANIALALDEKAFKQIAKAAAAGSMPFVTIRKVPEATIPQVIK